MTTQRPDEDRIVEDGLPIINRTGDRARVSRSFNSDMLVTIREARLMTQKALADALGVGQPLVGKWERELATPNDKQLDALAATLRVQTDFFFIDRPRRLASMSDFYHRAMSQARRSDVRAVHARCSIIDLQIDRMMDLADLPEDSIPSIDPDNHRGDIEKVASMARVALRIGAGPVRNLVDAIEGAGGMVIDRDLEVEEIDALCRWVPALPKLFFINGSRPPDRIRFSLAHELGHTVMHFRRDYDPMIAEQQANDFASALLMPAQEFRRDIRGGLSIADLASLKRKWKASMQAIARRAWKVGAIDETRYRSICVQMSRNGWRKTEPVEIPGETPKAFLRTLQRHIDAGYSVEDLSRLLLMSHSDVSAMLADATAPTEEGDGVRLRFVR